MFGILIAVSASAQDATTGSFSFSSSHYRVGERLTYNISYSNFISAAHAEFLVAARGTFFGRDGIQLKGHVETTGTVNAALLALNNDYITYVDPNTGLPFHAQQFIREASRASDASADFNQPAGAAPLPPGRLGEMSGIYDLLSVVYRIRTLPLKENSSYRLTVRIDNVDHQVDIKVRGQEAVKTNVGSFTAVISRITVKGNTGSYPMQAYFSSDDRHIPVLVTARYASGEIRAELAASEFIATPALPPPESYAGSSQPLSAQCPYRDSDSTHNARMMVL